MMFPTDSNYANRILGADFGNSKTSGNPMITIECEVVQPQEVEIDGVMVTIGGIKTTNYLTTQVLTKDGIDEEKTTSALKRVTDFLRPLFPDNPEYVDNFNPIAPDKDMLKALKGKIVLTMMESEVEERRKTPTVAQIEAAKKQNVRPQGDLMKHPMTGKVLINYWPKIREFFGPAPESVTSNVTAKLPY